MTNDGATQLLLSLQSAVAELNKKADDASKSIRAVDDVLEKLNVRYEIWLEQPFYENYHLGYMRTQSQAFNVVYRQEYTDTMSSHEPLILRDGPRLVRIMAVKHLEELQRALLVAIKNELAEAAAP